MDLFFGFQKDGVSLSLSLPSSFLVNEVAPPSLTFRPHPEGLALPRMRLSFCFGSLSGLFCLSFAQPLFPLILF